MATRHRLILPSFAGACLCALAAGCVTTTETRLVDPSDVSRNYPSDTPTAKNSNAKISPRTYLAYARLQESRGNQADARNSYEKVLADNPKSVDALLGLARLDQLAGRTADAERRYIEAARLESRSPRTLDALGQFYTDQGRWSEAVPTLNQAIQAAPEEKNYRYHLAMALAKAGQFDQAGPHFIQSVGPAAAHYNIGLILYEQGNLAASEQQFVQAIVKDPQLDSAQYWLDEVRREQETQIALANTSASAGVPAIAAYQSSSLQPSAAQRPQQQPPQATLSPRTAATAGVPHNGASGGPHIAAGTPSRRAPSAWSNGPQQGAAPVVAGYSPRQATPAQPAGHSTSASPSAPAAAQQTPPNTLTPQQWEQWNNQRLQNAGY